MCNGCCACFKPDVIHHGLGPVTRTLYFGGQEPSKGIIVGICGTSEGVRKVLIELDVIYPVLCLAMSNQ